MPLSDFIQQHSTSILTQAIQLVQRAQLPHYPATKPEVAQERLSRLLELTGQAVHSHDLGHLTEYARKLGEERFQQGFPLSEVQTAINVLEEAIWEHCVRLLPSDQLGNALGLCSTALGATKDCLARTYVSLASGVHVPSLNLQALFEGVE